MLEPSRYLPTKSQPLQYKSLTENRTPDQIKYKQIISSLRSKSQYNLIPYYVRMKSVKHFKLSYKRYRGDLKTKPKVIKSNSGKYTLVWPN